MPHRARPRNGEYPYSFNKPPDPVLRSGPEFGALEQRVFGAEQGLTNLSNQLSQFVAHTDTQFTSMASRMDAQFSSIATKIDERGRIPWAALGVMLSAIVVIGSMAYFPIRETQGEIKEQMRAQQTIVVPRTEHDREWARNAKAMENMLDLIQRNQSSLIPRGEWTERWHTYDIAHADHQRQIDEVRKNYGDTYSLKDAIKDMRDRVDRIETARLREANGGEAQRPR